MQKYQNIKKPNFNFTHKKTKTNVNLIVLYMRKYVIPSALKLKLCI